MTSIAIITARGGSKRIPRKNIKNFCGKPIIAYSIKAAIDSKLFDEVMVSTDDEEIADIAKKYGASVPFLRSAENSNDFATTTDVLKEVLSCYNEKLHKKYDYFACIYPTAPFVTSNKIKEAFKLLLKSSADSIMTVTKYSFPPQRSLVSQDGYLKYQYPEFSKTRSQDLEPIFHDCGQFYICKTDIFSKKGLLITDKTIPYEVPEEEVQDIDNYSDWNIAEIKYKTIYEKAKHV